MPTTVTARDGDCLCGIASDFGLAECKPLRDDAGNSSLLGRELRAGDEVTIPGLSVEATLHVSNFVTKLGGKDGLKALPTGYGFHEDGDEDLDTFKVEVWDPAAVPYLKYSNFRVIDYPATGRAGEAKRRLAAVASAQRQQELLFIYMGESPLSTPAMTGWAARLIRQYVIKDGQTEVIAAFLQIVEAQ